MTSSRNVRWGSSTAVPQEQGSQHELDPVRNQKRWPRIPPPPERVAGHSHRRTRGPRLDLELRHATLPSSRVDPRSAGAAPRTSGSKI